jgi:hypothetical protein
MNMTVQLAQRVTRVLEENDLGTMVMAAPRLYPHQWSWDTAFISIGLARISVPRAITEMRTLLGAQWDTGGKLRPSPSSRYPSSRHGTDGSAMHVTRAVTALSRSITAGSPAWTTHPDGMTPTQRCACSTERPSLRHDRPKARGVALFPTSLVASLPASLGISFPA